ncbi:MAG: type II/IV secretion system protein [Gemmatimonadota bacterium]
MNNSQGHRSRSPDEWSDPWVEAVLEHLGASAPQIQGLRGHPAPGLWQAAVQSGLASSRDILEEYSRRFAVGIADTGSAERGANRLLPEDTARKLGVIALRQEGRTLFAATCSPLDLDIETTVAFATGLTVRLLLTDPDSLEQGLNAAYPRDRNAEDLVGSVGRLNEGEGLLRELAAMDDAAASSVSTTDLVNALLVKAIRERASDVHIQPHEHAIGIRYRVDGVMLEVARLPRTLLPSITSRLKILANLDIADRMRPQDGRAQVQLAGRRVDLRISTLPVGTLGEKTVVRILDSGEKPLTLDALGFLEPEMRLVDQLFRTNDGLVLVTGPTGSGKTTTLYSALRLVQATGANIVTVEDPIEYRLDGVAQAQVNEKAGLTFATVLRSILRQDPDAVLVGEIRDRETAEVALQASMTGHLVLSTLHTNDATSTIMRLADMGVDVTALGTSLRGVMAQRLVRRICMDCRVRCDVSSLAENQQALLRHLPDPTIYQAVGCASCLDTGYRGRIVVPEIAIVTPDIEHAITRRAELQTVLEILRRNGMVSLWEAGLTRVALGLTTLNELMDNITPPAVDVVPAPSAQQSDVDAIFMAAAPRTKTSPVLVQSAAAPAAREPSKGSPTARARPMRVLLVDENAGARRELRHALEEQGITVNEAADGEAAMEYIERLKPDIVVLELALPKLDGIGVLRALRSLEACRTSALVLTVQSDPEVAVWAMELGAIDVLTKPINPHILTRRLLALLADAAA